MGTILVIDDSDAVRSQLKALLEGAGFKVAEAVDGNDGYRKLTALTDLSLVITDYNMPGMDGIAMLSKAKGTIQKFPYPIFLLTTETNQALKGQGKTLGVTAWINKPFNAPTLIEAIKKVTSMKMAS